MRHQAAQDREAAERANVHAERYLKGMTGARLHFCRAYYLGGMTLLQAAEMADRSTRQCERYRRDIYGRRDADGLLGDDEDDTLPPPGEMPECAG